MLRRCMLISSHNVRTSLFTQTRSTCIMRRKYPYLEPSVKWNQGEYPELPEKNTIWEVEQHTLNLPDAGIIEILLTGDVPGLGDKGDLLKVNRQRFWRYLNILNLAELPTPERIVELAAQKGPKPKVLRGDAYYTFKRLEKSLLHIPMNSESDWTLAAKHVKVAFRRVGVHVDEENIKLPDEPITAATTGPFKVEVSINGIAQVSVSCYIFLWMKLDKTTISKPPKFIDPNVKVEDWLAEE